MERVSNRTLTTTESSKEGQLVNENKTYDILTNFESKISFPTPPFCLPSPLPPSPSPLAPPLLPPRLPSLLPPLPFPSTHTSPCHVLPWPLQECREATLLKEKAEEEMRDLADTVEMATLDKEMAEERVSGV